VVKILLGLLIASFALWGVGDMFVGGSQSHVAEVGEREISIVEYQESYRNQVGLLSARMGRQLSERDARAFGIPQNVLQGLISSTAIDIHADELGLGISDDAVATAIQQEPVFRGANDQFNRARFEEALRNAGMSEEGFIIRQRQDMVRQQLAGTLNESVYVPRTLMEAMHHYRNDERVLNYFVVEPEAAGTIPEPTETNLKSYYEDNKNDYRAPEYRTVGILPLTPDAISDTVAVTDEQLKAQFEATKDRYSRPERRTVQQLVFDNMEAARAAAERLDEGADFVELGKERGMTESDINLGTFAKSEMANQDVAEAAFALEEGAVSDPIESFSTVIVRVADIQPGDQKSFEDVKDQVRSDLASQRARDEIANLYDAIEDARAGGANVQEAAEKLNLPFRRVAIDSQGQNREGEPVEMLTDNRAVVQLAFDSDVGVENNPISAGEGFIFLDVLEVIPERQKSFEEVRDEVRTAWINEETRKAVRAKAEELAEKVKGGAAFEAVAQEVNASVTTTDALKREANPQNLPRTAVSLAFSLDENGVGNVAMGDRTSQAVIQVAEARKAPSMTEQQAQTLRDELQRTMGGAFVNQYVAGLQRDYGVQINNQALSTVTGQ